MLFRSNWNNASKRLFGSYSHSGIPGFHSGYSAPESRIAGIYSGIHSYSGIFPNERALKFCVEVSRWLNKGAKVKKPLCDVEETEYMTEQFFVNRVGK